jgi:hypothetical protein
MRGIDGRMAKAIFRGRLVDDRPERSAEGPQAGETDIEADIRDASIRLPEQEHGPLDASPLEVAMGRLAEGRPEPAAEVSLRDVGHGRDRLDIQWLGIRAVHRVPCAKQAAIQILDLAAHERTLRDQLGRRPRQGVARAAAAADGLGPVGGG